MPVRARVKPLAASYSDEEITNYDRLIKHLNSVIDDVEDLKEDLQEEVDDFKNMKVVAETLDYDEEATATWDDEENVLTIGIPRGAPGEGGDIGGGTAIDDTQASAAHPWSGQKIAAELEKKLDKKGDPSLAGKMLKYDDEGNLVPFEPPVVEELQVTIINGGNSGGHEISLISGGSA